MIKVTSTPHSNHWEVMRVYQYVDSRGMGIGTKAIQILREFSGTEPELEPFEDYLKTIHAYNGPKKEPYKLKKAVYAPNKVPSEPKNEPRKRVFDPRKAIFDTSNDLKTDIMTLINGNPSITYAQITLSINISPTTLKRYLQTMKESGEILRNGGKKGKRSMINNRRNNA